jgi:pimeloyl-ACP methyl ester carboxylesterase
MQFFEGKIMPLEKTTYMSLQSYIKKGMKMLLFIFSALVTCILIAGFVLLIYSPGKPIPILSENGTQLKGSLSEKIQVTINGTKQGMFIRSKDVTHPVLLYLHGGMPDYFLTDKYPTDLEENFTVVWWEQRGSGMSYNPAIPKETMNLEQLVSDVLEVTRYLCERFGKEKIYLMGHSGGSFIGIEAAARAPHYFYAYIGVAQMSNQLRSERLAYEYMLNTYRKNGNNKMLQKLLAAPVTEEGGPSDAYLSLRDIAMHDLGIGTMHEMHSVITGIFLPSLTCREYSLREKINMWRGKSQSGVSMIWDRMLKTDLNKDVPVIDIPVYFLEGVYDYTCSYSEAKSYFKNLKAPIKGFYSFGNSAHSPIFEEPEKVQQILKSDILPGMNRLADLR